MLTLSLIVILLVCYSLTEASGGSAHNIFNNAVDARVSSPLGSLLFFLLDFLPRSGNNRARWPLGLRLLSRRRWPFRACFNLHFAVDVDQVDFFVLIGSALESIVKNLEIVVAVACDMHEVLHIGIQIGKLLFLRSQNVLLFRSMLIEVVLRDIIELLRFLSFLLLTALGLLASGRSQASLLNLLTELLRGGG